jgi:hypothetical protein
MGKPFRFHGGQGIVIEHHAPDSGDIVFMEFHWMIPLALHPKRICQDTLG